MTVSAMSPERVERATTRRRVLVVGATTAQADASRALLGGSELAVADGGLEAPERLLPGPAAQADAIVLFSGGSRSAATHAVRVLAAGLSGTPLIVVVPDRSGTLARGAIRAGASAVVREDDLAATLTVALAAAGAGLVAVPRELRRHIQREALSHREKEILGLVVMGFTNAEIAVKLFLAESTVKSHLSSSFMKLGVRSRNEAAALILDPEEGLAMGIVTSPGDGAAGGVSRGAA
jgi:DNA-binding NarL/FixJ family response regulator